MTKIVAFSGSHGVGKTSLIKKFAQEVSDKQNNNFKIFQEINTGFFNMGFAFNGKGFDFDEVMFTQKQAFELGYNLIKYYLSRKHDDRIILLDRSCIDTMIYTKYFVENNKTSGNIYKEDIKNMENKCSEIISNIEHILVPPFEDFDDHMERMNIQERDDIWESMLRYFKKHSSCYVNLKGETTALRYEEVMDFLISKQDYATIASLPNQFRIAIA